MSPRWLREDEQDSVTWERHQDIRLENLVGALVMTLGDRVQERMAAAAGCSLQSVAALQWMSRGHPLRPTDLGEALGISRTGASQLIGSLVAAGLLERRPYQHDGRQRALMLTTAGARRTLEAMRARAQLVREILGTLPFPWRVRLLRIVERLLGGMAETQDAVLHICRHCDWEACRRASVAPCPVAVAYSERRASRAEEA
jgi:DNA-binding MarR family transcriptional regulator